MLGEGIDGTSDEPFVPMTSCVYKHSSEGVGRFEHPAGQPAMSVPSQINFLQQLQV